MPFKRFWFGKLVEGSSAEASSLCSTGLVGSDRLPTLRVKLGENILRGLVDTGCSDTMIRSDFVRAVGPSCPVASFDGRVVQSKGRVCQVIGLGDLELAMDMLVVDKLLEGFDIVLGMDVVEKLGGVTVREGRVEFGSRPCMVSQGLEPEPSKVAGQLEIVDKDFVASFDGVQWTVKWHWKQAEPPVLRNKVSCYDRGLVGTRRQEFEREVERWIQEGILKPWEGGEVGGILAFMAVEQPTKNKVRPVFDFREVNDYVECHTGDAILEVCDDRLREWRATQ